MARHGLMRGALAGLVLLAAAPALAQSVRPAELPPADYAGQQYVDSQGCMFLRAGSPGKVIWVPRVTRQGMPMCGNPPSGLQVPVAEDGMAVAPDGGASSAVTAAPAAVGAAGHFVAVGSFGVAGNVDKALARLQKLNYPAARSKAAGGTGLVTVYAGPFETADLALRARNALRAQGFPDAIVVGP